MMVGARAALALKLGAGAIAALAVVCSGNRVLAEREG